MIDFKLGDDGTILRVKARFVACAQEEHHNVGMPYFLKSPKTLPTGFSLRGH